MSINRLAAIKLLDTLSRGLFVLICTFQLPLEEAGRFGLFVTGIGLLSLALAYERHIDMQRQVAGRSVFAVRKRIAGLLRFFFSHYIIVLPIAIAAAALSGFSFTTIGILLIIVIGEHLSLQAYLAALLTARAFSLTVWVFVKNSLLFCLALYYSWNEPNILSAGFILYLWCIASLSYILIAILWWWIWNNEPLLPTGDDLQPQSLTDQYKASSLHFIMGLIAVLALQADRFVVGLSLSPTDIGIYFRNIALGNLLMQFLNIASINRITPTVYYKSREGLFEKAQKIISLEWRKVCTLLLVLFILLFSTKFLMGDIASKWSVQIHFILVLIIGVFARIQADFSGILLLSVSKDRCVLINQTTAVFLGGLLTFLSIYEFGLLGAFIGACLSHFIYMALNWRSLRQTVYNKSLITSI